MQDGVGASATAARSWPFAAAIGTLHHDFDSNADGKIDGDEWKALLSRCIAALGVGCKTFRLALPSGSKDGGWQRQLLQLHDADADGSLSEEELVSLMQDLHHGERSGLWRDVMLRHLIVRHKVQETASRFERKRSTI